MGLNLPGQPVDRKTQYYAKEDLVEGNRKHAITIAEFLKTATHKQAVRIYAELARDPNLHPVVLAEIGLRDRFFLFTVILKMTRQLQEPWLYARFREVEHDPDGCLDIWAREHYKSSAITYCGSIQELAKNPNITIGIFSHTRPIAKSFLTRIKLTCEPNTLLPALYPETFWQNPKKDSPMWSLDSGLVMK